MGLSSGWETWEQQALHCYFISTCIQCTILLVCVCVCRVASSTVFIIISIHSLPEPESTIDFASCTCDLAELTHWFEKYFWGFLEIFLLQPSWCLWMETFLTIFISFISFSCCVYLASSQLSVLADGFLPKTFQSEEKSVQHSAIMESSRMLFAKFFVCFGLRFCFPIFFCRFFKFKFPL